MSSKIPGIPQNPMDPTFIEPEFIQGNPQTGEIQFGFPGSQVISLFGAPATKERQPLPKFPGGDPTTGQGSPIPPDDSANEGSSNN